MENLLKFWCIVKLQHVNQGQQLLRMAVHWKRGEHSSNRGFPYPSLPRSLEILLIFLPLLFVPLSELKLDDEVNTIHVKELDQDVLVLRRVSSHSPTPTSGSAESDWR